jgi:hypothetical protein
MKTARIALTADVRGFKQQMDEAKKALVGIGQAKISPEAEKRLKGMFSDQLARQARQIQSSVQSLTDHLNNMGKGASAAFDPKKASQYGAQLTALKRQLEDVNKAQTQLAKGKFPTPDGATAAGGGAGVMGRAGKMVAGLATGLGVMSLFQRRERMADQRLAVRSLTRGGESVGETSSLGYNPEERRERAVGLAKAAGGVSGKTLTSLTNLSETVERAYGIGGDETASAIGAARKAGVSDQGKFVSKSIGAAVAAGMEGSRIGEYLSSMTGFMQSMSEGISVDTDSLNGFAGALGSLPFFKNDPNRIFAAMQGLSSSFKGGDTFQKAQATRAILGGAPGASPASTEFRRSMGLFGTLDKETIGNLKATGMDTRALEMGGPEIVKNMFDEIMASTQGMSPEDRLFEFQQRTGMEAGPAASIFGQLASGKGVSTDQFRNATMSPQERLNKTFENADGSIKTLSAQISRMIEATATNIADPMAKLGNAITNLINALTGGNADAVGGAVGAAGVVAGGAIALGAGKALGGAAGKMAGGVGRLAKAGSKGGMKGMAKAAGRMGGKSLSRLIPGVGLIMAAKDAWDVYDKYQAGQEITPKDLAVLGTSAAAGVAGLIPGLGTGVAAGLTAASVGAEFLPENMGMGTPSDGLPVSAGGGMAGSSPMTPSNVIPFPGGGAGAGNDVATNENTSAIRDLTAAIRGGGGNGAIAPRYPSNASSVSPSNNSRGKAK